VSQPSDLAAGKRLAGKLTGPKGGLAGFQAECARLRLVLADQIEKNHLHDARETVLAILCLDPNDADALGARELIEEQLASAVTHPVGEIRRMMGHQSVVNSVAFTPDGRRCISGGGILVGSGGFRTRTDNTVSSGMWKPVKKCAPISVPHR